MELSTIITIVTIFVTYVCGILSKKSELVNNKLIPFQNLAIGIIAGLIYFVITKDINLVIASVGLGTGGAYDVLHNLGKILEEYEEDYIEER